MQLLDLEAGFKQNLDCKIPAQIKENYSTLEIPGIVSSVLSNYKHFRRGSLKVVLRPKLRAFSVTRLSFSNGKIDLLSYSKLVQNIDEPWAAINGDLCCRIPRVIF